MKETENNHQGVSMNVQERKRKPPYTWNANTVKTEIERIIGEHILEEIPSNNWLKENGYGGLCHQISRYPGGSRGLHEALGYEYTRGGLPIKGNYSAEIESLLREYEKALDGPGPISFSEFLRSTEPSAPHPEQTGKRTHWSEETIEQRAREIYEEQGQLNGTLLARLGELSLQNRISTTYSGGMRALRSKLGIEEIRKPSGFWTDESIENEARKFFEEEGDITFQLLRERGNNGLANILNINPGRLSKLRERFGLKNRKPYRHWTSETIENEAREILQNQGDLSFSLLRNVGKSTLASVIARKYPGGMQALREKLGLNEADPLEEVLLEYLEVLSERPIAFKEFMKS